MENSPLQTYKLPGQQATTDEQVVSLWLQTKNVETTVQAYSRNIAMFLEYVQPPIGAIKLSHIQDWHQDLMATPLAERTKAQRIASVRSFFKFAKDIGYIQFNPAKLLKSPRIKDDLAERILTPEEVDGIIDHEQNPRNKAILILFYETAIRVSELCALKWRDVQPGSSRNEFVGQITIFGKGGKTRAIKISPMSWEAIAHIKNGADQDKPVFLSQKKGHLARSWVRRIVKKAGERVGIKGVSPHWFRHSHASHSIEAGAPLPLVRETLGHASISSTSRYLHARPGDSSGRYLMGKRKKNGN